MDNTARLYRNVIDEVLHRTQEDILLGQDEHVATRIVHNLQTLWETKLAQAQAQASEAAQSHQPMPGQNDPSYQAQGQLSSSSAASSSSSAPANPYEAHPETAGVLAPTSQSSGTTLPADASKDAPSSLQSSGKRSADEAASSSSGNATKKRKTDPSTSEKEAKEDGDSDDSSLGSDSDDDIDEDKSMETDNLVLCQYLNRVKHHKSKWKCQLRDGIMHLNGRDYVFSECSGDFRW